MSRHSWEAGLQHRQQLLCKTNVIAANDPHPSFLLAFSAELMSHGQFESAAPRVVDEGREHWRDSFDAGALLSSSQNTGFFINTFSGLCTAQHCEDCPGEGSSIPARSSALLHQTLLMNRSPVYHLNAFVCMNILNFFKIYIFIYLTIHIK